MIPTLRPPPLPYCLYCLQVKSLFLNKPWAWSHVCQSCHLLTRKPSWSKGDARQQCVYEDPWQISLSSSMLLMVNSICGRILLIVCDIFLRKEARNRHFGRYSDAKTTVYTFKVIQGWNPGQGSLKVVDLGTNRKSVYTFLLVINSNFSPILHRFGDMAA